MSSARFISGVMRMIKLAVFLIAEESTAMYSHGQWVSIHLFFGE